MRLSKLTEFLDRLDDADIHYTISSTKEGTISIGLTVPGEYWEVDFMQDGDVEVEVFESTGDIRDFTATDELFKKNEKK